MIGLVDLVAVKPPKVEVAVYDVIAEPPFDAGAVNATVTCPAPGVRAPNVGAPGVVAGITALDAADAGPVPIPFVAVTLKVYDVPFVSPVTINGPAPPVIVTFPGVDVTVYDVMTLPPFDTGGVKLTVALALPLTAVTAVGAPGTVAGITLLDGNDGALSPDEFNA